jgi:hypothetical protein
VNLGWLYRNTEPKQVDQSIAAYKKALELNPRKSRPRWAWAGRTST